MGIRAALARIFLEPEPKERAITWPFVNFEGRTYPLNFHQTLVGPKEEVGGDFEGLAFNGYGGNGIVHAVLNARMALFTQARPMFRNLDSGQPGKLWSNRELQLLRVPWPNGTTADLLARMCQDADLAGNAFIVRLPGRLARLRPDWVTIVHGQNGRPSDAWDPRAEVLGYIYQAGGPGGGRDPISFVREEVAHFAPIPDPLWPARGMSWLTPLIREIEADTAATTHKLQFFRNGATPSMIVTGVVPAANESLQDYVARWRAANEGVSNAYKTQFFTGTTSVNVVGKDLQQIDFRATQGAGEVRIANAGGVPATVVGLSEGLAGSSLNAGNFASAMRRFADLTGRPWWANAFGSLATIINVPSDSELWYDDRFVPALKDDIRDAAEVRAKDAQAIGQLVRDGWTPESVKAAVIAGDWNILKHTGLYSVQLQPPQPDGPATSPEPPAAGEMPVMVPSSNGKQPAQEGA